MNRKLLSLLLLCVLAAAGAVAWRWSHPAAAAAQATPEPAQVVSDITLQPMPWQSRIRAFGQVRAVQGADLSAEVAGIVDTISFQSGADVPAGTVLLRLRANDDDARLATLQASADLWAANVARDQKQFDAQAISRATLDMDNANLRSFRAQVAAQQSLMAEKIVRAPFAGRLGIRLVDLGQYLNAGTAVVTLQALDPIYVDFNLPQQQVGHVTPGQAVEIGVDNFPGRVFKASVLAVNSVVDPASRMASVRASLRNPDHALLPGMFAIARLAEGGPQSVLAVPVSAISYNPYGNFVYVVKPKTGDPAGRIVESRVVTTGETLGDLVVVQSGLASGDHVVTAGQVKLRNGASVRIDNSVQPEASTTPEPAEE